MWFSCALFCCVNHHSRDVFNRYSSELLHWHWDNRSPWASGVTQSYVGKIGLNKTTINTNNAHNFGDVLFERGHVFSKVAPKSTKLFNRFETGYVHLHNVAEDA